MSKQVTESDIRLPQFKDAKLEDLEFDPSGEVVRKDRFYTGMKRMNGILIEHGISSARDSWTVDEVVNKFKILMSEYKKPDAKE